MQPASGEHLAPWVGHQAVLRRAISAAVRRYALDWTGVRSMEDA